MVPDYQRWTHVDNINAQAPLEMPPLEGVPPQAILINETGVGALLIQTVEGETKAHEIVQLSIRTVELAG